RRVGANGHKAGEADIEQPCQSPLKIESQRHQREDQRGGQEESAVADEIDHLSRTPKRPIGRTNSTAIRMMKETAARHSAPINCTAPASASPMIKPPSTAPGMLPMPPRMAAANIGSSMSKPMNGRICTRMPIIAPPTQASAAT